VTGTAWIGLEPLSILLSINGESVSLPCVHISGPPLQAILLQSVEKWTTG